MACDRPCSGARRHRDDSHHYCASACGNQNCLDRVFLDVRPNSRSRPRLNMFGGGPKRGSCFAEDPARGLTELGLCGANPPARILDLIGQPAASAAARPADCAVSFAMLAASAAARLTVSWLCAPMGWSGGRSLLMAGSSGESTLENMTPNATVRWCEFL